jgi:hypothetical protein
MQREVDMPRLVEFLKDWDAVRLGALGPLDAKAAEVLNRKRAAFLVDATEKYGVPVAEVFALFILHSAFDDELREVVQLLAQDKQLGETLGMMAIVREELERRGLKLAEYPDRAERAGDVLRGLGRAGRDVLSSTEASAGARYIELSAKRGQLPLPYQQALDEVESALMEQHYSSGSVALGSFDHLTFGVPMGFYHLVAGTGQGAYSLYQDKYEQATRELAPAALMVALYAGSKGARYLSKATGTGRGGVRRLQVSALDLEGLKSMVERMEEQLGVNAARDLFRYMQASRENAYAVAQWGEAGAQALYETRGHAARAQAVLAKANRERTGPTATTQAAGDAANAFKWGNPSSKPTYGHTFLDHTMKLKPRELIDRARGKGHQIGQWLDDNAAAGFIAEVAKKGSGIHDFPIPRGVGRSFLGDGTELSTDMARVVVKPNGSVRTAYPYNSAHPNQWR